MLDVFHLSNLLHRDMAYTVVKQAYNIKSSIALKAVLIALIMYF